MRAPKRGHERKLDAGKIQALIDNVADCQQQAIHLCLGLIHYFLDMAVTELKMMQAQEQSALAEVRS